MISVQQQKAFICDKVGHQSNQLNFVCMKNDCEQPILCCIKCKMEDHLNHQNHEFVDITKIRERLNSHLHDLNQLNQISISLTEFCHQWKNQIVQVVNKFIAAQHLTENYTLDELAQSILILRQSDYGSQYDDIVQVYTNRANSIKLILNELKDYINSKFQFSTYEQQQIQQIQIQNHYSKNLKFNLTQQLEKHVNYVDFVAISHDDSQLASSESIPSIVFLWDAKTAQVISQFYPQYNQVFFLQFSNDNTSLAVSSYSYNKQLEKSKTIQQNRQVIEIFDLTNFTKYKKAQIRLTGHESTIWSFKFLGDSQYLISISHDQSLRVWDLNAKMEINRQNFDSNINGLTCSNKQQMIGCCCSNGYAYLFDSSTPKNINLKVQWEAHSNESLHIELIKNSTVVMTCSDSETRFWQVEDLLINKIKPYKKINGGYRTLAYPIDNPQVIMNGSLDLKCIKLWNYDSKELIQIIEISGGLSQLSFVITSDFTKIITGGKNAKINIFEKQQN